MHQTLISFGLIILAGVAFRRLNIGGIPADEFRNAINVMVFNLFLPALGVWAMYRASIGMDAVLIPATAWITTLATLGLSLLLYALLGPKFGLSRAEQGVLVIAATFGNVTYLGLPVLQGLYGNEAIKYALYYDLLATTPVLWLVGAAVAAHFGSEEQYSLRRSVRTVLMLPPLWGIALGMLLNVGDVPLPGSIMKALELMGGLVVPLMIFTIGLSLSIPSVRHTVAIAPAMVIKLAIVPLISFGVARAIGVSGMALASCLMEGAMPTMVLSLLVAAMFGLDVSLAAFVIVVSTALAFFTLPLAAAIASGV
jgi:predicted permease